MLDRAKWKVHGPVHTLRSEFAEWDLTNEEWQLPRHFTLTRFLPGGRLGETEAHNPDGSIFRSTYIYDETGRLLELLHGSDGAPAGRRVYIYDELGRLARVSCIDSSGNQHESESWRYEPDGRKTKVYPVPKLQPNTGFMYTVEETEQGYSAGDAATVVTSYDVAGHPTEALFQNAEERPLRRVVFERDSAGRLVKEALQITGPHPFVADIQKALENMPAGVRESAASSIEALFGSALSSTTYVYDPTGRVQERLTKMSGLGQNRMTFRYDDRGNPIEQIGEDIQRELEIDDEGRLQVRHERSHRQDIKMEYVYDALGNWTERVVWSRLEPNPTFQRSNIERRTITYYPA